MMNKFKHLEQQPIGSQVLLDALLPAIRWNESGLIPAIAQDHLSGEVLMLAWMNVTALRETLNKSEVCYWSRSRQALWRKGETSGHRQRLIEARLDCDGDALLLKVDQVGPACHTLRPTCFYLSLTHDCATIMSAPVSAKPESNSTPQA